MTTLNPENGVICLFKAEVGESSRFLTDDWIGIFQDQVCSRTSDS